MHFISSCIVLDQLEDSQWLPKRISSDFPFRKLSLRNQDNHFKQKGRNAFDPHRRNVTQIGVPCPIQRHPNKIRNLCHPNHYPQTERQRYKRILRRDPPKREIFVVELNRSQQSNRKRTGIVFFSSYLLLFLLPGEWQNAVCCTNKRRAQRS